VKQQFWPSDSTLEAVTSSLEVFDLAKKVKGFPPDKKDINSIKSFDDLEALANEVKDLAYGLYGKTPVPIDPEVRKKILKGYKRGETPVTGRAADYLEPELEED